MAERSDSPLDFGIMCGGDVFQDWQAKCIGRLLEMEGVNLRLLIVDGRDPRGNVSRFLDAVSRSGAPTAVSKAVWQIHQDYLTSRPPARRKVDLTRLLDGVDRVHCTVEREGFSEYFPPDDIESIERYDLDFVLRFSFGIIRGRILTVPTYGVWSFHHGDERRYRGSPAGFWEIYNDDPVTGAILQRLTDELDGGVVLKRGRFKTIPQSREQNLNKLLYATAGWPAQVATDILNGNVDATGGEQSNTDAPIYTAPNPHQLLGYHLKRAGWYLRSRFKTNERRTIGLTDTEVETIGERGLADLQWFPARSGDGSVGDPFVTEIGDDVVVFFTDYTHPDAGGRISYCKYEDGAILSDVHHAFEGEGDVSYPYVLQVDGRHFVVSETRGRDGIHLYEAVEPGQWEFVKTLVPGTRGVAPTLFRHADRWWLFFTKRNALPDTNLYVWSAETLFGAWRPHENNPVKTDVRGSRPAGKPWIEAGQVYRPARDYASPGSAITVNRITELSEETFEEETCYSLSPGEESPIEGGVRTISHCNGVVAIGGTGVVPPTPDPRSPKREANVDWTRSQGTLTRWSEDARTATHRIVSRFGG
ncbi:glucosamine inositolphosphorylceramide transferase family protein [Salinigranum marinum]|uniref:glucosamine inositolphosphorylceramide transferase family protein n=1 Tax=Salinigranum marinum TaxID=1515595 RepID=UPI002989DBD0|nr:hypothetical protein [Salinigranum marinum]